MVARTELRSRWASLLGLALIVALVSAVVLTALAGARRTSSSLERFRDWAHSTDATVQSGSPEQGRLIAGALRRSPAVDRVALRYLVNGYPSGADAATPDFAVMSDPDGHLGVDVDRMRMRSGRMPSVDAPDEIVLTEQTARLLHRGIGDHLHVRTFAAADLDALSSGGGFPGFRGPPLDLTVVGVGRVPDDLQGNVVQNSIYALGSPAFVRSHPGIGAWPPAVLARATDPAAGPAAIRAAAAAAVGGTDQVDVVSASDLYVTSTQGAIDAAAVALVVFAVVAGLAGVVVVGQTISRQVTAGLDHARVLRSLGADGRQLVASAALPASIAGVLGVALGAVASVPASALLPNGLAGRAEIDPGIRIDPWVLGIGTALIAAAVLVGAVASATRARRLLMTPRRRSWRPSSVAEALARRGAPASPVIGVRFTFAGGDRGRAAPSRVALVSVTVAIAGLLGAAVVAGSVDSLLGHDARWGWNWSSAPQQLDPGPDRSGSLQHDDRIAAMGRMLTTTVVIDGHRTDGWAMESTKGSVTYTLVDGRLPSGPSEVALGERTMARLGVSAGDVVRTTDAGMHLRNLTVVGRVVLPSTQSASAGSGAVLTPDGLRALAHDTVEPSLVLRYAPGVDVASLERSLTRDTGLSFPIYSHGQVPGSVRNVAQSRGVAVGLAWFLAALGMAGLLHSLVVSTRTHRVDLAVLRAVGFRRPQVRRVVLSQATATVVVGLLVGIPVGLVVGRFVWRVLVQAIEAVDVATTPWLALVGIVPAALAVAALTAWGPGRAAVRRHPADALRAD